MKNIYIFGCDTFKKNMKHLLKKENIDNYEVINTTSRLQEMITLNPKEHFLIDQKKIYSNNILNKYLKFLIPKDGIEKSFLSGNNIALLEFDSPLKAVDYLKIGYDTDEPLEDIKEISNNESEASNTLHVEEDLADEEFLLDEALQSARDLSEIKQIDEIEDHEMDSVLSDIDLAKG